MRLREVSYADHTTAFMFVCCSLDPVPCGYIAHGMTMNTTMTHLRRRHPQFKNYGGALNDYPCGSETVMSEWLSLPEVMTALHVVNNTNGFQYSMTAKDLLPLYAKLIHNYRMLIYSGDVDGCIPYWGSEEVGFCAVCTITVNVAVELECVCDNSFG